MNNKGQTLIETLLVLPLLIFIFSGILIIFLLTFTYFYSHYHLHEATFCSLNQPTNTCKNILIKNLRPIMFVKFDNINLSKNSVTTTGTLTIRIPSALPHSDFLKITPIRIQKSIENRQWL